MIVLGGFFLEVLQLTDNQLVMKIEEKNALKTDNELIAEFMGMWSTMCQVYADRCKERVYVHPAHKDLSSGYWTVQELEQYQTDWNWLMAVVEKIQSMDHPEKSFHDYFRFGTSKGVYWCEFGRFSFNSAISLIDAFWTVVVEFIKWYNDYKN